MFSDKEEFHSKKYYEDFVFDKIKEELITILGSLPGLKEVCDYGSLISFEYYPCLISISKNANVDFFYNKSNFDNRYLAYLLEFIQFVFRNQKKDFQLVNENGHDISQYTVKEIEKVCSTNKDLVAI